MKLLSCLFPALLMLATPVFAASVVSPPDEASIVGRVVPNIEFEDDAGRARELRRFEGQPLIVLPVYTRCHGTCSELALNLKRAVLRSGLDLQTFQVFLLSFDPVDTTEDLTRFRDRMGLPAAWILGRAKGEQVMQLTSALDYRIARDSGEWIHPNVAIVLGPTLAISGMLRGPGFSENQVVEALAATKTWTNWKLRFGPYIFAIATMTLIFSAIAVSMGSPEAIRSRESSPG